MGKVWRVTEEDDDAGFIGGFIVIGVILFIVGWIIKILAYVLPVALVIGLIVWIVKASRKANENRKYMETVSVDEAFKDLTRYHNLLNRGAITQKEYDEHKIHLLSIITGYMEKAVKKEDASVQADALNKLELWHSLLKNNTITQAEYEFQKGLCLALINSK